MVSVRLRPTKPEDLEFVLEAGRDPDNARFLLPWTKDQHARALADPDVAHRIIELGSARDRVGFVLLLGVTSPHGSLEFRRVVVTAAIWTSPRSIPARVRASQCSATAATAAV